MQQVVIAGLVGAGVGYLVRFGQEQIPRAVRGLAGNELVAGTAKRGRDVVEAGVKGGMQVAQAGAQGGLEVARAGARGGLEVARAGAQGGLEVARAAAGRAPGTVRPAVTGRTGPGRAVRVPVGKDAQTSRRTAGPTSKPDSARKRGTVRRRQSTSQPKAAARSTRRTTS
jgi:hypothetical protein